MECPPGSSGTYPDCSEPPKSSEKYPVMPPKSAENYPVTPPKSADNDPVTPPKSSDNDPVTPSKSSDNDPVMPPKSAGNDPVTPSKTAGNDPVTPPKSSDNDLVTPPKSSDNDPVTPSKECAPGTYGQWPNCKTAEADPSKVYPSKVHPSKVYAKRRACRPGTARWPYCRRIAGRCGPRMVGIPPLCFPGNWVASQRMFQRWLHQGRPVYGTKRHRERPRYESGRY